MKILIENPIPINHDPFFTFKSDRDSFSNRDNGRDQNPDPDQSGTQYGTGFF
jgi:hypothetical protein